MPATPAPSAAELAISLFTSAFERMPERLAYAIADSLLPALWVWGAFRELRAGRAGRGARRNLRIAYRGSLGPLATWRLLARHGRHLAHLFVDVCRMPGLDASTLPQRFDVDSLAPLRVLLSEGRGLICVSAHLGPWEILGHAASVSGLPVTVVVRRLRPGALDRALDRLRTSGGQRCVPQRGALLAMRKALARGEIAGLLADRDERRIPVFAPFLGTLAATSPAAAFLQRISGAPIAVVSCERSARGRYRLRTWRVLRPRADRDLEQALRATSAEINASLGDAIRARPEQWLWGSRRFATRPAGETPGPDGLPPRVA